METHIVQQLVQADQVCRLTKILRTIFPLNNPREKHGVGKNILEESRVRSFVSLQQAVVVPITGEVGQSPI